MNKTPDNSHKYAWTVAEWAAAASISRSSAYELLGAGALETVKFGGKRLILTHPRDWLRSLRKATAGRTQTQPGGASAEAA